MNFGDLLLELPDGLHDATISEVCISYVRREVSLVATVGSSASGTEEIVRDVRIVLAGVVLWTMDPPDSIEHGIGSGTLTVDAGTGQPGTAPPELPPLPDSTTLNWIYVADWNSFIRFACGECSYHSLGEARLL